MKAWFKFQVLFKVMLHLKIYIFYIAAYLRNHYRAVILIFWLIRYIYIRLLFSDELNDG